jgi:hypothetical protein
MHGTMKSETSRKKGKSRITNNRSLFPRRIDGQSIDNRGVWTRRLRDLVSAYTSDAGGIDNISEGLKSIIRRIATIQCALERMEAVWARDEGDDISQAQLDSYQRLANSQRRLIETAGLKTRSMKTVPSLQDHLASRYGSRSRVVLEHEDD